MALVDINMVQMEEIFLPYIRTSDGKTFFQQIEERKFFLGGQV